MTSDAKIGLLLGLVFIFMIAFIINGLPSFHKDTNNNELTTNMASSQNNPPGIGAREREVINRGEQIKKQPRVEVQTPSMGNQNIRFTTRLPKSPPATKETNQVKPTALPLPSSTAKKEENRKVKPSKPTLPKFYVVNEDDNLAFIAKKFYGAEEGNKRINVTRIFDANRKLLKSPDEIYVGQKLIIPPLSASRRDKAKIDSVFSPTIFKTVESVGRRRPSTGGRQIKQGRHHTVREDDSLWRIAAEQLGDGSRYTEIARLNTDILDDEDNLVIGMRLKLPAR